MRHLNSGHNRKSDSSQIGCDGVQGTNGNILILLSVAFQRQTLMFLNLEVLQDDEFVLVSLHKSS